MPSLGHGLNLWHVRVDLIAPDHDGRRVEPTAEALAALLTQPDGDDHLVTGVDQGIGVEGQAVLGLSFWVWANDVGAAATLALQTAKSAGAVAVVGPTFYDVVVVPRTAVVMPCDGHDINMPR